MRRHEALGRLTILVVLALILLLCPTHLFAAVYYVSSSTGDDTWPGTESRPWKTLGKVSSQTFQPNDQILLKRGDTWEGEELVLNGSGRPADEAWITLGPYGDGPKPRITNPPFDPTPELVNWDAVNEKYPDTDRRFMKIAVKLNQCGGWVIRGIEIDHAEMGIYALPSHMSAHYLIEDCHLHDILGLFIPPPPEGQWFWWVTPAWGSAILVAGDYVTVRDVVIERATGGINGEINVGLIENAYIDKVKTGALNWGSTNSLTTRYVTVLNAGWPDGCWFGSNPVQSCSDTNFIMERLEIAYADSYGLGSDATPIDIDMDCVNCVIRDCFLHDNIGSALEFNLSGENHRITVENNVCYNNGLWGDPPAETFSNAAFSADAVCYPGTTYTIRNNSIYKAYTDQYLNYYFCHDPSPSQDFSPALRSGQYALSGNTIHEAGSYTPPLPVPAPPPISRTNIAPDAAVTVSTGAGTAQLAADGDTGTEWVSGEPSPWIRHTWDAPQTIDTIRIFDRPDLTNWATSGVLTFSDGSSSNVTGGILNNGAMREVVFDAPKSVTWVQFTVTRSSGTCVGLTEFQAYLAEPPSPEPPKPSPGTFTVDFSDRSADPSLLLGRHPDTANGIDWKAADWTTAAVDDGGNRCAYIDFPRNTAGQPVTAWRIFVLPPGKTLKSLKIAGPQGATVSIAQIGQREGLEVQCTEKLTEYTTGWNAPAFSNVVRVWIDTSGVADGADVNAVCFDDIAYGD